MNIILIGMMGSGKTTVGRILAYRTHRHFVDLDQAIRKESGMSIPEIFQIHGEEHFRRMERNQIERCLQLENTVIATGGGAPCFEPNWELLDRCGYTVYLAAQTQTLFDRLQKSIASRPLLKDTFSVQFLQDLTKKREPFYFRAKQTIQTDGLTSQEVADSILKSLPKHK